MEKRMKHLSADSRSQISSGTVITCVASAVKELVENSLDAGATTVDIRLTEFGTDVIEVADNGHGVEESDFEALVLKSHTSKLLEFEDLTSVESFGFRGEALSALCVLSEMTVQTRVASSNIGHELVFDQSGNLVKKSTVVKKPGTTVFIKKLFHSLPVRRGQLVSNARKEMAKLLRMLNGYGIVMSGVRLTCENKSSGKSVVVMRSSGDVSMLANINEIFEAKQQKLVALKMCVPSADILEEYNLSEENVTNVFTIEGWISDCKLGSGRSANDRQFLFINRRPCEYPKISKLINERYREFNAKDFPFYAFDIHLDRENIDINVVPNKNQVLVQNEKLLMATITACVRETFRATPAMVPVNNSFLLPSGAANSPFAIPRAVLTKPPPTTPVGSFLDRFKYSASSAGPLKGAASIRPAPARKAPKSSPRKRAGEGDGRIMKFFKLTADNITMDTTTDTTVMDSSQSGLPEKSPDDAVSYSQSPFFDKFGSQIEETESFIGASHGMPVVFSQFSSQASQPPIQLSMPNTFGSQPFSPAGFGGKRRLDFSRFSQASTLDGNVRLNFDMSGEEPVDLEEVLTDLQNSSESVEPSVSEPFVSLSPIDRPFVSHGGSALALGQWPVADLQLNEGRTGGRMQEDSLIDGSEIVIDDGKEMEIERQGSGAKSRPNLVTATNFGSAVGKSAAVPLQSPLPLLRKPVPAQLTTPTRQARPVRPKSSPRRSGGASRQTSKELASPTGSSSALVTAKILHRLESGPKISVSVNLAKVNAACEKAKDSGNNSRDSASQQVFQAGITPPQNETAEKELERNIKKADFLAMRVIGQFNNGFIVTQLDHDCFLIDQHASDERFNYEALQSSFTLEKQPLIRPMQLELTAGEETILLEHVEIFRKNGFSFSVESDRASGRISLTSAPIVHSHMLGKDDILEMLHILGETGGVNVRPTRILQLIASKACRKSVMIGTALNVAQMTTVVSHMARLLEPWRCAHGRPTIRHLFNVTDLETS